MKLFFLEVLSKKSQASFSEFSEIITTHTVTVPVRIFEYTKIPVKTVKSPHHLIIDLNTLILSVAHINHPDTTEQIVVRYQEWYKQKISWR